MDLIEIEPIINFLSSNTFGNNRIYRELDLPID